MHIPAHNVSKINSDSRDEIFSQSRSQIRVSISSYFCPQISSHQSSFNAHHGGLGGGGGGDGVVDDGGDGWFI